MHTLTTRPAIIQSLVLAGTTALASCTSTVRATPPDYEEHAGRLSQDWDKTFPRNDDVEHHKVTFKNRYGITLAADLYLPKARGDERTFALAVGGPFGAVKEQSSGLYAQTMAAHGFVTLAFDPSYTGESSGEPRNLASPDINTEDFSAAVDFLGLHPRVNRERIGIIGICGWGGMALNAAAVDKRIKAVVASTMYDMTRVMARGYNDSVTPRATHRNARAAGPAALAGRGKRCPFVRAGIQRVEGRRSAVPDRLPRLLPNAAGLPSTGG